MNITTFLCFQNNLFYSKIIEKIILLLLLQKPFCFKFYFDTFNFKIFFSQNNFFSWILLRNTTVTIQLQQTVFWWRLITFDRCWLMLINMTKFWLILIYFDNFYGLTNVDIFWQKVVPTPLFLKSEESFRQFSINYI